MSNISNRIKEEKRRIRIKKQELQKKRRELKNEIKYIQTKLREYRQSLQHFSNNISDKRVKEIADTLGMKLKMKFPFMSLNRLFVRKELEKEIRNTVNSIDEKAQKIEQIKKDIENVNICPDCKGLGSITKTQYVREDGIPRSILESKTCLLCKGKGRIL